jgi:hypothetical protein
MSPLWGPHDLSCTSLGTLYTDHKGNTASNSSSIGKCISCLTIAPVLLLVYEFVANRPITENIAACNYACIDSLVTRWWPLWPPAFTLEFEYFTSLLTKNETMISSFTVVCCTISTSTHAFTLITNVRFHNVSVRSHIWTADCSLTSNPSF